MRTLQHRTNNAYDTILLLDDGGKVIGEWQTTRDDAVWQDYCDYGDPRDLDNWEITNPDCTDPDDYGTLSDIVPLGHFWDAHDVEEIFVVDHAHPTGQSFQQNSDCDLGELLDHFVYTRDDLIETAEGPIVADHLTGWRSLAGTVEEDRWSWDGNGDVQLSHGGGDVWQLTFYSADLTTDDVDLVQGDADGQEFGYVHGTDGGFFFTWHATLDATLESIEADDDAGAGGLEHKGVESLLRRYLPTTAKGRTMWIVSSFH